MNKCGGKGFPGCSSCINQEFDPFECEDCDDESNWEGDEREQDEDDDFAEDISISDFRALIHQE